MTSGGRSHWTVRKASLTCDVFKHPHECGPVAKTVALGVVEVALAFRKLQISNGAPKRVAWFRMDEASLK